MNPTPLDTTQPDTTLPEANILEQARRARDSRFDGRFFVGVKTTGIYCRPVCPVKLPRAENVCFYESAAAASEAGYRPCLRCRPEASPGTPAWMGTSTTVRRALRLINEGELDGGGTISELSLRLGVTPRHLSRLFTRHLGASPKTVAQTRRLQFAKKLIDETHLSMTDIAMSAGYGSIRRFNDHFRQTYQQAPGSLRQKGREKNNPPAGGRIVLHLGYRAPYDFKGLLDFYRFRAIPGVEEVTDNAYRRSILLDLDQEHLQGKSPVSITAGSRRQVGRVQVTQDAGAGALCCEVQGLPPGVLMAVVERVRRMFDVDAIPEEITRVLAADKLLARLVTTNMGQRLPGAWDGFEIAVRAIVGQQVSVKGATTVMGKIAARYGERHACGLLFPDAEQLAELDPATLPMPKKRAVAIKSLAVLIADRVFCLDGEGDAMTLQEQLLSIPGIGPWTAAYIAMRAFANPDAFLHGDLVIRRVAQQQLRIHTESELIARAERWRPWRAYAGMHLWRCAAQGASRAPINHVPSRKEKS